jgi:hypothetical protein
LAYVDEIETKIAAHQAAGQAVGGAAVADPASMEKPAVDPKNV